MWLRRRPLRPERSCLRIDQRPPQLRPRGIYDAPRFGEKFGEEIEDKWKPTPVACKVAGLGPLGSDPGCAEVGGEDFECGAARLVSKDFHTVTGQQPHEADGVLDGGTAVD